MKIMVCMSHVPDTTSKIRFVNDNKDFNDADVQFILSPYEELALTRALELKDKVGNLEIVAVNVGIVAAETSLRKALAIGADEAIRVDATPIDAAFVATQLAEVVRNGGFDCVLLGRESIDYNGAQVGEMLAELLDWPSVSSVSDFDIEGNVAKLTREIDGGKERVSCTFPLVATGQKGIAKEPRIPSMKGIMFSRRKAIAVVTAVDCKKFTVVLNHELPPAKAKCKIIPADKPEELARLLHEEAKVI